MKYKITVTSNMESFFMAAPMEMLSGSKKLTGLNSLLRCLSANSPEMTIASLENFYRFGGFLAIVTYKEQMVGIACLIGVNKVNGVTGRIEHVVISPNHRGKGLSRKLMDELIRIAQSKKMRYLDLTTEPSRAEANGLYRSLGFVKRETNPYRFKL